MLDETAGGASAFHFEGAWREYAPIAFTNLPLSIVTPALTAGGWQALRRICIDDPPIE